MEHHSDQTTPTFSEGARITLALTFKKVHQQFLANGLQNSSGYLRIAERLAPINRFRLRKLQHQTPDLTNTMALGIDYWADVMRIIIDANTLLKSSTSNSPLPDSFESILPSDSRPAIKEKAEILINQADPEGLSLRRSMKAPVTDEKARQVIHNHFMRHTFETSGPVLVDLLNHELLSYEARVMLADVSEKVLRYKQDPEALDATTFHETGAALLYVEPLKQLLDANRDDPDGDYEQEGGEALELSILALLGSHFYAREFQLLSEIISEEQKKPSGKPEG
ncbi:hypothetical protein [Marinobacter sp.]|uniref:hypothetical protein n=1 Tax=Marinobacter sp. TaxID=50741 RepID=UPI003569F50B